jgi:hypothetical protein
MQKSNISAIAKVKLFNFGQIINHLLLQFPAFQPPFHPDNNAIISKKEKFILERRFTPSKYRRFAFK